MPGLNADEKALVKKGTWRVNMNMDDEKFVTTLTYPFQKAEQIGDLNKAVGKVLQKKMMQQMSKAGTAMPPGMDEVPEQSSFDDYYDLTISSGVIEKKLNKERYAKAEADEYLKGLKDASGMGAPVTVNYAINLPRPATKVEGKKLKLSADKKKVTFSISSEDFFDDPSKLEYRIEY